MWFSGTKRGLRTTAARRCTARSTSSRAPQVLRSVHSTSGRRKGWSCRININLSQQLRLSRSVACASQQAHAAVAQTGQHETDNSGGGNMKQQKEQQQEQEQRQPRLNSIQDALVVEPCSAAAPCRLCRLAGWRRLHPMHTEFLASGMPWGPLFDPEGKVLCHSVNDARRRWPDDGPGSSSSSSSSSSGWAPFLPGGAVGWLPLAGPPSAEADSTDSSSGGVGGSGSGEVAAPPALGPKSDPLAEELKRGALVPTDAILSFSGAGVLVAVVSSWGAGRALEWLQADPCFSGVLAVDLEWCERRSNRSSGSNRRKAGGGGGGKGGSGKVALIQVASAGRCVLFHTAQMGFQLPPELRAFLVDPRWTVVVQGWEGSDERKMVESFGFSGLSSIPNMVDLQHLAAAMGYHRVGLAAMSQQLLDSCYRKSKSTSCSDWEAGRLSQRQIRYAALDAFNVHWMYFVLYRAHLGAVASPLGAAQERLAAQEEVRRMELFMQRQAAAAAGGPPSAPAAEPAPSAGGRNKRRSGGTADGDGALMDELGIGDFLPDFVSLEAFLDWRRASLSRGGSASRGGGGGGIPCSRCASCQQPLGALVAGAAAYPCSANGCGQAFGSVKEYLDHCAAEGHGCELFDTHCDACGRLRRVRGEEAAALFESAWVPSWRRRMAWRQASAARSAAATISGDQSSDEDRGSASESRDEDDG